MADQIKHGSIEIVNATSVLQKSALADSGVAAGTYTANTSQLTTFTVDAKGFVTATSNTTVKMTGIDFKATGNTLSDQTIYVNTTAPTAATGADGDIWYQTQ
jgi:hypothetical protein